ncbi:MAG: TRAP transporter large permease subunit [Thiolinea sp.]
MACRCFSPCFGGARPVVTAWKAWSATFRCCSAIFITALIPFPLMAIPFFMLAGDLMNRGGITLRLVDFSQALMGRVRGGLAHVNIMSSMLFAGLSGSAVAQMPGAGFHADSGHGKEWLFAAFCHCSHCRVLGDRTDHSPSGIMIIYAYTHGNFW